MMKNLLAVAPVNIGTQFGSPFGVGKTIGDLISLILKASFAIAGVIVVFYFVMGGIQIVQGAGNDDPKAAAAGKQAVTSAVIGFVIVFVAYWVVRLIEVIVNIPFITAPTI